MNFLGAPTFLPFHKLIVHSQLTTSKKQRKHALEEFKIEPMRMGGLIIEHAVNEKYLGDYVSELGCKQSIE